MSMHFDWKPKLKNILFINLKTVSSTPALDQLDERFQRQWEQKVSYFRNEENWTPAEWYQERASYYAEYGKILCIGFGGLYWDDHETVHLKVKTLIHEEERFLLQEFVNVLERYPVDDLSLCAHNGKEFDYPFLCRRLLANNLPLPRTLQLTGRKPWENPHQDILERWRFGDSRHFVPLELLAAVLGIPSETLDLTSNQVSQIYYQDHDTDRIRQYARESIVTLVQVYLRLLGVSPIQEHYIKRER